MYDDLDLLQKATRSYELAQCSIAQILRDRHPKVRVRREFLESPLLERVTLEQLVSDAFALSDFLDACRHLPHCGETSIRRLREVLKTELSLLRSRNAAAAQAAITASATPIDYSFQYPKWSYS
ncbi:hypothetical protein LY56_01506 [Roseinatronobacter thiooxidans]|uniref:Uncharacterized protein n=1 Tax=Roseinatronobacter thiooxidans TaxID=121821 RepID=A0A2W7QCP7_9RHOB|nr:hypothetical protein [Roseinatronobacter thiooxidans]PZX45943.1 hypothetical protein LY56_01506 [Roseinatronobacter thiooxidans]